MSENRKTEIVEEEIEDFEEEIKTSDSMSEVGLSNIDSTEILRDEVFEQFKLALLNEDPTRILGKFYNYCYQYTNFEFDESAMNMDEADDVLRKVNILRDKLLESLEEILSYRFEDIKTNTLEFQISFTTTIEDNKYTIIIEVFPDSFDLEIE
ncbi:MAG: hypothetical protein K8R39_12120 [Arcobacteraceae bacterium]|nr:hypothetical protein [Arcobacteraceae bacterium]